MEVFHGVAGGTNITGTYISGSDGNWKWELPETTDLIDTDTYIAFITAASGSFQLTAKIKRKATYYPRPEYA